LSAVDSLVRPGLEHWLNHNSSVAEAIVARIILAARAREASRAASQEVTRKRATSGRLNLPGKLSDCTGAGSPDSELSIVDADSDGNHIATRLLTFIYRHIPQLIKEGKVFLAQPPLYRIDIGKDTFWALDDGQRDAIVKKHKGANGRANPEITRFKGLGEMMPKVLWETTL